MIPAFCRSLACAAAFALFWGCDSPGSTPQPAPAQPPTTKAPQTEFQAGPGIFEGNYLSDFETRSFTPLGAPKEQWAVSGNLGPVFDPGNPPPLGSTTGPVSIKVEGRLSVVGKYGHGGMYSRELLVERVLEARGVPVPVVQTLVKPAPPEPETEQLGLSDARKLEAEGRFPDAVRIYRRLARRGDTAARDALVDIYERGHPGIPRDPREAQGWRDFMGTSARTDESGPNRR